MTHLKKITIMKKIASLDKGFIWDNIPSFSVIAGINGAGKTKFLEAIYNSVIKRPDQRQDVSLIPDEYFSGNIRYIPINHNFEDLSTDSFGTAHHVEKRNSAFLDYIKSGKNPDNSAYNNAIQEMEKKFGESIEEMLKNNPENIFSPELSQYIDDGLNNKIISEIFKSYQMKIIEIKASCFDNEERKETIKSQEQIYNIIGCLPPWKVINALFSKYNFIYNITEPKYNLSYSPEFIETGKNSSEAVKFSVLSSGEKIIVTLILWAYNQYIGNKIKILLLDEFDAHLNPSMSKMFIEVVKDKLVGEFGIQVIMTTHSPSTVAYVQDDDLFWMERGKNIQKTKKNEIIPILSNGIMTFQEAGPLLECIINNNKEISIFAEGELDVYHIKVAGNKLCIKDNFDIFHCDGADKLKQFLIGCPSKLFNNKLIIGIFDYDEEGLKQVKDNFKSVDSTGYLYQSKSNLNIFVILLPVPNQEFKKYQNCPIEFLYSKELLISNNMLASKRHISEINKFIKDDPINTKEYDQMNDLYFYKIMNKNIKYFSENIINLNPSEFTNFKPLFDIIGRLINENQKRFNN